MGALISFLASMFSVGAAAYLLPGVRVDGLYSLFWAALLISIVNSFLKPVLVLLTLPITFLTLGLFTLVINGIMIVLVSAVVPGFEVASFFWAVIFSVVLGLINSFVGNLVK